MKFRSAALSLSSLLVIAGSASTIPVVANAQPAGEPYVACNQFNECWRVHNRYAYGSAAPITYYKADWYDAHQNDEHVRWLADPADDRGYYDQEGSWHRDPGARALAGGATGAGLGAAIGCLVTLPIGCAPGAAVGAAGGGGTGAIAGAATTPRR